MSETSPTLLLAEANPDLREALAEMLTTLGYAVRTAGTAREAVLRAGLEPEPRLLIAGASLADTGGLELIDRLRERQPSLRAIVLSGFGESAELHERSRRGNVGFLAVPFSAERLGDSVSTALRAAPPAPAPAATPGRPARTRGHKRAWGLAAAAVLAVGLAATLRFAGVGPPPLRSPADAETLRGARLQVIAPVGELAAPPHSLEWHPVAGAISYRVHLTAPDETLLWEGETSSTSIPVPDDLLNRFQPAVTYRWTVEALEADRSRVAWSALRRFQLRPEAPPEPQGADR